MNEAVDASGESNAPGPAESIILLLILIIPVAHFLLLRNVFWDLDVVRSTIDGLSRGHSPYLRTEGLKYVYPPVTLDLLGLVPRSVVDAIIVLNACILFVPVALVRSAGGAWRETLRYLALLCVPLGGMGVFAFATGNLTIALHALVLLPIILSYRSRSLPTLAMLTVVIVFASMIKPYFLAYFMVLFFRHRLAGTLFAAVGVAATACLVLVYPDSASVDAWIDAMARQTGGFRGDMGNSLFGLLHIILQEPLGITASVSSFIAANFALNVVLGLAFLLILPRFDTLGDRQKWFYTAAILLIAIIINPRLKEYDAFLLPCLAYALLPLIVEDRRFHLGALSVMLASYGLHFLPGEVTVSMVSVHVVGYAIIVTILVLTIRRSRSGALGDQRATARTPA